MYIFCVIYYVLYDIILNASRNPTSPSSASSCGQSGPRYRQLGTKMAAKWSQNGANLAPKWSKMEPKWVNISKKIGSKKQRNKKEGGTSQAPPC